MKAPFTELYVHLVWATWDRLPLITPELERAIYACVQTECAQMRVEMVEIGGTEDHVHVLVRLPTTVAVAEVVKQVKGSSSHLVTHRLEAGEAFKWQGCYGAFTVSRWDVARIRSYIQNQKQHHSNEVLEVDLETCWTEVG